MMDEEFYETCLDLTRTNVFELFINEFGMWKKCIYCKKETPTAEINHRHTDTCRLTLFFNSVLKRRYPQ